MEHAKIVQSLLELKVTENDVDQMNVMNEKSWLKQVNVLLAKPIQEPKEMESNVDLIHVTKGRSW